MRRRRRNPFLAIVNPPPPGWQQPLRNPDEDLRLLERAAKGGDPAALRQLLIELDRRGLPWPEIQWTEKFDHSVSRFQDRFLVTGTILGHPAVEAFYDVWAGAWPSPQVVAYAPHPYMVMAGFDLAWAADGVGRFISRTYPMATQLPPRGMRPNPPLAAAIFPGIVAGASAGVAGTLAAHWLAQGMAPQANNQENLLRGNPSCYAGPAHQGYPGPASPQGAPGWPGQLAPPQSHTSLPGLYQAAAEAALGPGSQRLRSPARNPGPRRANLAGGRSTTRPVESVEGWPGYDQSMARGEKFHGAPPAKVKIVRIDDGKPGVTRKVVVGIGYAPEVHYTGVPKGSNKHGYHWVHKTKSSNMPLHVLDPETEMIMTVGGAMKVSDWLRQ